MLTRWIERTAWVVGCSLLGMYGGMRLWAQESSTKAVQEFRAMSVAPADQTLWSHQRVVAYQEAQRTGDAPEAVLRLPELSLEVPVYGDTSDLNLDRGAGRIPGTATLDQSGNLGIAAHRDGFFRKLKDATIGMDLISMSSYGLGGAALSSRMTEPGFRKGFAIVVGVLLITAAGLIVARG